MSQPAADPLFSRPKTLFIGIGAQKSGTTWLADYLAAHPDVHMTYRKELHFWNTVRPPHARFPVTLRNRDIVRSVLTGPPLAVLGMLGVGAAEVERRRRRAYARMLDDPVPPYTRYAEALLAGYEGQAAAGEITPAYALLSEDVLAEIAGLSPGVRFLYIMRDPATRLVSGLRHGLRQKLGAGFRVTPDRVVAEIGRVLADPDNPQMLRSRYDLTISRLERVVDAGRVHYAFYEELFADAEIARLCAFLGVAHRPAQTERRVHRGRDRAGILPAETMAGLQDAFAPVYAFVEDRFGRVPDRWRRGDPARVGA